jgi:hypothetical protein
MPTALETPAVSVDDQYFEGLRPEGFLAASFESLARRRE